MVNWGGRTLARDDQRPWYSRVQAESEAYRYRDKGERRRRTATSSRARAHDGAGRASASTFPAHAVKSATGEASTREDEAVDENAEAVEGTIRAGSDGRRWPWAAHDARLHCPQESPTASRRSTPSVTPPGVINSGAFGSFASFVTVACSKKLLRVHEKRAFR